MNTLPGDLVLSADELRYFFEELSSKSKRDQSVARDVDVLVSEIKENLRLSGLKSKSRLGHKNRFSPYDNWQKSCRLCKAEASTNNHMAHEEDLRTLIIRRQRKMSSRLDYENKSFDPYEQHQELVREGGLIKEAVKRFISIINVPGETAEEDEEEEDILD